MNQKMTSLIHRHGLSMLGLLMFCLALSACGQSGELRHPDAPAPEDKPAATE